MDRLKDPVWVFSLLKGLGVFPLVLGFLVHEGLPGAYRVSLLRNCFSLQKQKLLTSGHIGLLRKPGCAVFDAVDGNGLS